MTNYQASKKLFSKIFNPMLVLIIAIFITHHWTSFFIKSGIPVSNLAVRFVNYTLACILWIIIAWLVNGVIDIFVWDKVFQNRLKITVPSLIKDIVIILVYFSTILLIATNVFGSSVNGFLAASGLIGLIIGFAIKNLIADLFNGLALNFDSPFRRGELLMLQTSTNLGVLKVVDTTWRTTRFETENNDVLVVPNSKLGSMVITNLSKNIQGKYILLVNVEAAVPTARALMILEAAVKSAQGVLASPEPTVLIRGIKNNAIVYKISYWLEPTKMIPSQAKHAISMNILRLFNLAGFSLFKDIFYPSKIIEGHYAEPIAAPIFLPHIGLFEKLTEAEINTLADNLIVREYKKGTTVVELDEPGDSLFVVVEGLLSVWMKTSPESDFIRTGCLTSGEYFGEMSFLTGAPRSAKIIAETDAVLYEITREVIAPLLNTRPELIEQFSQIMADRDATNEEIKFASSNLLEPKTQESLSHQIARKIKNLFGFK